MPPNPFDNADTQHSDPQVGIQYNDRLPEAIEDTARLRIQAWMDNVSSNFDTNAADEGSHLRENPTRTQISEHIGRLIDILYPPPSFDHADLQLVHHATSVCRDEALFQLMAAEHRMMFFVERLEASRRELERIYLNYCRAVEVLESGLDLQGGDSGEDVEMGGEGELEMAFVQPAAEREVDLNEEEPEYADVQV